jgi:hypothetical protein
MQELYNQLMDQQLSFKILHLVGNPTVSNRSKTYTYYITHLKYMISIDNQISFHKFLE